MLEDTGCPPAWLLPWWSIEKPSFLKNSVSHDMFYLNELQIRNKTGRLQLL